MVSVDSEHTKETEMNYNVSFTPGLFTPPRAYANARRAKLSPALLRKADGSTTTYHFGSCVLAGRFARKHGYTLVSFAGIVMVGVK
jgi:hypothetical protein